MAFDWLPKQDVLSKFRPQESKALPFKKFPIAPRAPPIFAKAFVYGIGVGIALELSMIYGGYYNSFIDAEAKRMVQTPVEVKIEQV